MNGITEESVALDARLQCPTGVGSQPARIGGTVSFARTTGKGRAASTTLGPALTGPVTVRTNGNSTEADH